MTMTEVHAANLGATPYINANRTTSHYQVFAATFNTPASSWNTIVIPAVVGCLAGDTIKLSVYKGSMPDDPNDDTDNSGAPAQLVASDLLASSTYTVQSNTPASGISAQFDFNTTFSATNCGATYTVLAQQFDSSNNPVSISPVFCTARDGVYNYINTADAGAEGIGFAGFATTGGGAGNVYSKLLSSSNPVDIHTQQFLPALTTINGITQIDACPAWGIYSREVVTLNSTAYGTTRSLTAPLTNSLTASLT